MPKRKEPKCPLIKAECLGDGCMFWIHIHGKNPQSDEMIDKPGCAVVWLPLLMIENSKEQRRTNDAVGQLRKAVTDQQARTELFASLNGNQTPRLPG